MSNHAIRQCPHGTVIMRCKCMGPHNIIVEQSCPEWCEAKGDPAPPTMVFEVEVQRVYNETVYIAAESAEEARRKARSHLADEVIYSSPGIPYADVPASVVDRIQF